MGDSLPTADRVDDTEGEGDTEGLAVTVSAADAVVVTSGEAVDVGLMEEEKDSPAERVGEAEGDSLSEA